MNLFIALGLPLVLTLVSGVILTRKGRPIKKGLSLIHKLFALLLVGVNSVVVVDLIETNTMSNIALVFLIFVLLFIIGIFITGAFLSQKEPKSLNVMRLLHNIFTVLFLVFDVVFFLAIY